MKKSIKIAMVATLTVVASVLVKADVVQDVYLLCKAGTGGICVYNPIDGPGYECLTPPSPLPDGDCSGMVEVQIPNP